MDKFCPILSVRGAEKLTSLNRGRERAGPVILLYAWGDYISNRNKREQTGGTLVAGLRRMLFDRPVTSSKSLIRGLGEFYLNSTGKCVFRPGNIGKNEPSKS